MNTTRSTFNGSLPPYTVVGGGKRLASTGICAVLLGRGGRYVRNSCFKELQNGGFDYVLSMETPGERYDIEELSGLFPFVRFIMFKDRANIGQQINIAAAEADTPLFFVFWSDFHPVLSLDAERIVERLMSKPVETAEISAEEAAETSENRRPFVRLCTAPVIQNSRFETIPTAYLPVIDGRKFKTAPFVPVKEGEPTLYPFDASGVYDRARFISLGGFDPKLDSAYWQLLDFGLRSWLWGEEIRCTQQIRFMPGGEVRAEDSTAGESYLRFFLKNLAPVIQTSDTPAAYLPLRRFLPYLMSAVVSPLKALRDFIETRNWVASNSRRFTRDVNAVSALWKTEPSASKAPK
ncbi:MAG: hypothetical protein LBJ86_02755 [Spirochaetaceae bacterium]|jgi:hypothetical protein|nr:hypothetical protein [Spirochaetaceae bacterium]